jgi:hypothetical protein
MIGFALLLLIVSETLFVMHAIADFLTEQSG